MKILRLLHVEFSRSCRTGTMSGSRPKFPLAGANLELTAIQSGWVAGLQGYARRQGPGSEMEGGGQSKGRQKGRQRRRYSMGTRHACTATLSSLNQTNILISSTLSSFYIVFLLPNSHMRCFTSLQLLIPICDPSFQIFYHPKTGSKR
jgi:hypothetical protein